MSEDDTTTVDEAISTFDQIDGVDAKKSLFHNQGVFLTISDEDNIGRVYAAIRRLGGEPERLARDGLDYAVMDGWVELDN